MEIFPVTSENDDREFAFEIENVYASRRTLAQLLKHTDGVTDVRLVGHFGSSNDIRIEFRYLGIDYVVWEPFGDNSRYWVGPKNLDERASAIDGLQSAFKGYQPPLHRKLLGELLTLRLLRRIVGRH